MAAAARTKEAASADGKNPTSAPDDTEDAVDELSKQERSLKGARACGARTFFEKARPIHPTEYDIDALVARLKDALEAT